MDALSDRGMGKHHHFGTSRCRQVGASTPSIDTYVDDLIEALFRFDEAAFFAAHSQAAMNSVGSIGH
jgi:hypothetical protein